MRVFLDANILFSAAKSDGAVRELLSLLVDGGHELWADGYVVEESRRNIALKAPDSLEALAAILGRVTLGSIAGLDAELNASIALAEKDRPVLAAAIRHRCDVLITGDRLHFGALYGKVIEGVEILAPAAVAARLIR
ncbi:MAG TPA: PIN domain-containing protein [Usitatibacter sp.]|nr:PIN domain-containing protein [Usitatibacter sp.]